MKLISMTDYVLEQNSKWLKETDKITYLNNCISYANFLKQPLKLGMFVPCDENDVPLEEPSKELWNKYIYSEIGSFHDSYNFCFEYQQAKERVLFDGFELCEIKGFTEYNHAIKNCDFYIAWFLKEEKEWKFMLPFITVECLVKYDLTLTESAIKKFNI